MLENPSIQNKPENQNRFGPNKTGRGIGRTLLLGAAALLAGAGFGILLLKLWPAGISIDAAEMHGLVLESPVIYGEFELDNHHGESAALSDYRGEVVLVYYGYTHCPDVCPGTLAELSTMLETLGRRANQVQVLMVSVDPERDNLEKLGQYVTYFHPDFVGLTGSEDALAAATIPYGIFYERHAGTAASGYLIDHSAGVLLFDKSGQLRMLFPFGVRGEDIADDVRHFLR